jgi:class 3 adenylate cyclase/tetratricopeptide (TPR) repeat protein
MEQVGSCEEQAEPGEIFVSPECQSIIDAHFVGELIGHNFRLDNIESPMSLPHTKEFPLLDVLKTRLRSYVPGAVLSNLDTHDYLAELRTISVLFVKLDYTYVNEDESPMAIQIYVAGMQAVIARYEGTVRQFIVDDKGSVLIAAFGLPPLAHEDDPTRAVECALEIDKVLKSLNMSGAIGITTGNVFCGAVGSEARREYAMVGDVVNMSARLMVAAVNKGGILCDRSTYMATKSSLKYAVLDPIKVKGKDHPIEIYRPEKGSTPASLNGPQRQLTFRDSPAVPVVGGPTPGALIGQSKVVTLFGYKLDQLNQHNQNPGHVLILEGEAGIGKSKLVEKLAEMANKNADIFLGTLEFGGTQQLFGPWALVFDTLLDIQNGEIATEEQLHAQVIEDINNISNSYAPPELFPSWESIAPLLNMILPLLGLPETDVTRSMNEQTRTETLQLLLLRLLQTYVLPGSIIVLEDAHEFDSASWTLALAASQQLKGVLIVICMRPPRPPVPFEYQQILHCEHATHVSLKPLSSMESIQLAESILELKNTRLPIVLANLIGEKGQGNPFIIEQMIGALKSSGAITVEADHVKIKDNSMLSVPTTVYGLITSKIDRLSPLEKNILKIASVIGKVFDYNLVKHLLPSCEKKELLEGLGNLVKAGLIVREENATALDTMESEESAERSKSRRSRVGSLSSSLTRRMSIGPATNRRGTDAGVSDETASPTIEKLKRDPRSSSPTVKHAKRSPPPPLRSPDSPRSEDDTDPSPPRRRKGQKIEKPDPKITIATASTASQATSSSSSVPSANSRPASPRLNGSGSPPNSSRIQKSPRDIISDSTATPSSSAAPSPVLEKAALRPSSPRPTRPTSPRRFDGSETPRRTLRRGLSMRGTSRSLTLRKMSLTSDGGTPRASAVDSMSDEIAQLEASEWSFRNQTIHECVYTMMLFAQRRHIHSEIAKWYEVTYHEALSHHAAILGYHLKMAEENPAEAAKWFAIAGQKALRNFSNQEAVSYFLESIQLQKRSSKHVAKPKEAVSPRSSPVKITLAAPASPRGLDEGTELSLLTTHRKLGQAYFNLGDFNNARLHLRLSLKVVKLDLSPGPWKAATGAPVITKLKEFHTVLTSDAYTQREVILALLTMAKVCYFSCSLDLAVYCNHASLALAKHSNFWSELSEAYAQCIVTAGLCDQHQLASQYIQEGSKLAQDHLALMSTMNIHSGLYYLSRCAWQLSKRVFKSSMEASQAMGDRRRFEDVLIFNGQTRLIRGKFKPAVAKVTLALNSARLRGDVQCQILALIVQIVAHLSMRNFMKATSKLDQVRIMLSRDHTTVSSAAVYVGAVVSAHPQSARRQSLTGSGTPLGSNSPHLSGDSSGGGGSLSPESSARSGDLSSEFNYHTLMASLCLARGDTVAAYESIRLAEDIMLDKHVQPAGFWMFPGYMGVPEIYLRLLMHPREWKKIHMTRNKLIKRFNRAIEHLRLFSRIFLFAAPRFHLLMGLGMLASGTANLDKVLIEWKRGQDLAKQYKMTGEEQLIQSHMEAEVTPAASTSTSESLLVPRSESGNDQSAEKPKKRKKKTKRGSTARSTQSDDQDGLSPRTADAETPVDSQQEQSEGHSATSTNAHTPSNFGRSPLLDSDTTSAEASS